MVIKHRSQLGELVQSTGLKGSAAEIGVAEGFFSAEMLAWPVMFPHVYMVDSWCCRVGQKGDGGHSPSWHAENLKAAQYRVAKHGQRAVILQGDSHLMALHVSDLSLALLYIDGDHSYEGVLRDITSWHQKVECGGIMAFHDYENPAYGVKKAVNYFARQMGYQIYLLPENHPDDAGAYFYVNPIK